MPDQIVCRHIEIIDSSTHVGTCKLCGQQLQYDNYEREITRILKRGSINGIQTIIRPPTLPKEERKAPAAPPAAPPPLPEVAPVPVIETKPQRITTRERLDKHREEVLADYQIMTITNLERKWEMGRNYFYYMRKVWKEAGHKIPTAFADREATAAPEPAPKKPSRKKRDEFLENNREAIIHDYHTLPLLVFFKKWQINSQKWTELKPLWKVESKGHKNRYTQPKVAETEPPVDETKEAVDETPKPVVETPAEPFISKPLNKRSGVRAIRNF